MRNGNKSAVMKNFMTLIGIVIFVIGIAAGVYVGFWLMFIGGITDIIAAAKAPVTEALPIGLAVIKIFFASVVGAITFWFCAMISVCFIQVD